MKNSNIYFNFASVNNNINTNKLESDEQLFYTDLLCEGPIEGVVDKYGNLLNFSKTISNNISLGKGIYYNDVPIVDSKLNKLNFVNSNFSLSYGDETNIRSSPSTVYKYDSKLYLNELDRANELIGTATSFFIFAFFQKENNIFEKTDISFFNSEQTSTVPPITSAYSSNGSPNYASIRDFIIRSKTSCREFTHRIKNKYCDYINLEIGIDQLFKTDEEGNVLDHVFLFAIEIYSDRTNEKQYIVCQTRGISRGDYNFDIGIPIEINSISNEKIFISIIPLSQKVPPTEARKTLQVKISSITEYVSSLQFNYPYSVCANSTISSRHFANDPNRAYDLKLLKIKIPSNYDAESREYIGNWNGKFDSLLKWSDNPAWVYYDICTNTRYGLGSSLVTEGDLNKWELYKISKFCDTLVKTQSVKLEKEDFFYIKSETINENCIYLDNKYSYNIDDLRKKYNPIVNGNSSLNGGFGNSVIFLYDLFYNNNEISQTGVKKIVWEIVETEDSKEFKFVLINDFGPKKMFETIGDPSVYADYSKSIPQTPTIDNQYINTEMGAKNFLLEKFKGNISKYSNILNKSIFDKEIFTTEVLNGKCYPKRIDHVDALEPRFSANLLLSEESETLKLLNDFASIFRGMTYYKNNLITATIDVEKETVYLFNNTNVKDGFFNYSSGSLEGQYTVAKVLFKDKNDNFNDSVEIIEDTEMMSNYGIILKEIIGFGATTRDQARRIGSWLLLTNRFENQVVLFSTDLQGVYLKPGDVVKILDEYKNNSSVQGRILDFSFEDLYIIVDRRIDLSFTGGKINFLKEFSVSNDSNFSITNSMLTLEIDRIENNSNKIFIKSLANTSQTTSDLKKLLSQIKNTTPFIITKSETESDNLYKIISISESDSNEYAISAIKYEKSKYDFLDLNYFSYKRGNPENNTIVFSTASETKEITLPENSGSYFISNEVDRLQISNSVIDYTFSEYTDDFTKKYLILTVYTNNIFNAIENAARDSTYYQNINEVLKNNGGLLFRLSYAGQSIMFKVSANSISNKKIFLGLSDASNNSSEKSGRITKDLKVYLFNQNDQIVEVDDV